MYQIIDETKCITVEDWEKAGLSYQQFRMDSQRGYLKIYRRGIRGNTLIDVKSIKRPDRLQVIERAYGSVGNIKNTSIYNVELSTEARQFYLEYTKPDGSPFDSATIESYTNKASLFEALKKGLELQTIAMAKAGKRVRMGEWYQLALDFYKENQSTYPCSDITNVRSFERAFKQFLNDGYISIIHGLVGGDNARKVSVKMENLLLSLWRTHDKPFINRVYELYVDFISGSKELYDAETGETFRPQDFSHKGRAVEISEATVWNYLKDVVNQTAVYADRNGNFDYSNKMRPKHTRKLGKFSLSKISMDDVALSRKSNRGWVYKYIAVDVVSGYYFRPAYVVGKPTIQTIVEAFRNMFCELSDLGLPMPGELEVESHLMKDIPFLNELFPFVRFCVSPTEKRAEHAIRALKYGAAKDAGHTRGRWYAKHEAYKVVRNKVEGDYTEPEYQPQTIVADDLADIEAHNRSLHPLQRTYTGMTRKEVLLSRVNPDLKPIKEFYLWKYIGNSVDTSIYNNNHCPAANCEFELADFTCLQRLKPNDRSVTAYWLPAADGSVKSIYLYQKETYIGEAVNRSVYKYNECQIERTEEDKVNILHQNKRIAQFDKMINDRRSEIPNVGKLEASTASMIRDIPVEIVENEQPKNYEEDEFSDMQDYAALAIQSL